MTNPTEVQLVAIAGVVKDAQLTAAKRSLTANTSYSFDFMARITGSVQVGTPTPSSSGTTPATVTLFTRPIIAEALRRLDVSPADLRRVLKAIVRAGTESDYVAKPENAELLASLDQVGIDAAKALPARPWSSAGRAGAVRTEAAIEIVAANESRAA